MVSFIYDFGQDALLSTVLDFVHSADLNSAGDGHVDARIYVGAKYAFNDMFEVGVNAGIWFGNCFYKDNTEKSIH